MYCYPKVSYNIIIISRYHIPEILRARSRHWRRDSPKEFALPPELAPLIPGIYADAQGCLYLNMREFLTVHGMPDVPQVRAVAWEEIKEVFIGIEVIEITD